jgi:hypothetical protein
MRYVVTTKRPSMTPVRSGGDPSILVDLELSIDASRREVDTLEEARREAGRACLGSTSLNLENVEQARTLPESGGTVGPLPDGTVIEVRPA